MNNVKEYIITDANIKIVRLYFNKINVGILERTMNCIGIK
jgi:hypothetical protein